MDHNENAAARSFEEPFIFPEEEELLALLENAGVHGAVNDKAVALLRRALERAAVADQVEKFLWELARRGNANTQALTRGPSREAGEFAAALAALRKDDKCRT